MLVLENKVWLSYWFWYKRISENIHIKKMRTNIWIYLYKKAIRKRYKWIFVLKIIQIYANICQQVLVSWSGPNYKTKLKRIQFDLNRNIGVDKVGAKPIWQNCLGQNSYCTISTSNQNLCGQNPSYTMWSIFCQIWFENKRELSPIVHPRPSTQV